MSDPALDLARRVAEAANADPARRPEVTSFFDAKTNSVSYVVHDPATRQAAIVDPVLGYDAASGRTSTGPADPIVAHVEAEGLDVAWLIETHVHADHLTAAPYLKDKLGGTTAIGRGIVTVQEEFGKLFNAGADFARDGSQFDHLFDDGERFAIGGLEGIALHVPGHTPADTALLVGDAAFVGDTMFMPDFGTARADFPGGDARQLYRSVRRLLSLPTETRLFLCHDYKAPGRDEFAWETSVGAQRQGNVHLRDGVAEDEFFAMRSTRDATLAVPALLIPAVQVNMRGGRLPPAEDNGVTYLKIPVNAL